MTKLKLRVPGSREDWIVAFAIGVLIGFTLGSFGGWAP
jgi:hypothetical protein